MMNRFTSAHSGWHGFVYPIFSGLRDNLQETMLFGSHELNKSIPRCSMVLEYLPTFA